MIKIVRIAILCSFLVTEKAAAKHLLPLTQKARPDSGSIRIIGESRGPRFAIKLNLTPLIFRSLSVQAEYAFHKNMSVALGASLLPKRTLSEDIYNFIDENPYTSNFSTPVYEGKAITPEFRVYPFGRADRGAPAGFYIAAYYRYANYKAYQTVSYQDVGSPEIGRAHV